MQLTIALIFAFIVPLGWWFVTLAYAFGRLELLWTIPLHLTVCVVAAVFGASRLVIKLPDEQRIMALMAYAIILLLLMLAMVFLFEWDQALRWHR